MGNLDEYIREANKVLEQRQDGGIGAGGWELHGKINSLLRDCFI
jgi:hypothetical protein